MLLLVSLSPPSGSSLSSAFHLTPPCSSPDFAEEPRVHQQAQREANEPLQEQRDEHPPQDVHAEWVLIGVHAVRAEDLDLQVDPGQLHQPVPKTELREHQEDGAEGAVHRLGVLCLGVGDITLRVVSLFIINIYLQPLGKRYFTLIHLFLFT